MDTNEAPHPSSKRKLSLSRGFDGTRPPQGSLDESPINQQRHDQGDTVQISDVQSPSSKKKKKVARHPSISDIAAKQLKHLEHDKRAGDDIPKADIYEGLDEHGQLKKGYAIFVHYDLGEGVHISGSRPREHRPAISQAEEDQKLRSLGFVVHNIDDDNDSTVDAYLTNAHLLPAHLIRVKPPTRDKNCHGHTFAREHHQSWIDNWKISPKESTVQAILHISGARAIDKKEALNEDIVVYTNAYGKEVHSGIVQANHKNSDSIIIESKWDDGSVFFHDSLTIPSEFSTPYGPNIQYYRLPESWHGLQGVASPPIPVDIKKS